MQGKIVKILYQTFLPYQGRYPRVSGQAKILKEAGYDITILGCDREGHHATRETIEGIAVERIRVKAGEMKGPFFQLIPLISFYIKAFFRLYKRNFDMLHCHNLDVLPLGYIIKKVKGIKLIFDAHEPNYYALWPKRWRFILKFIDGTDSFLAKRADAVTVTNDYQVKKYQKIQVKRVELIGNYPPPALRFTEREEMNLSKDFVVFGRFGTFYPDVGIEETMEAFNRIVVKYPKSQFLLGGRAVNGYRDSFLKAIAPSQRNIEYIGPYEAREMQDLYKKIDVSCLVYPKNDWFRNITPRKFFDSMANGVPVIMTDIGGLGDVIRKHKCGLVVDEKDINEIYEAMELIINNKSLLEEMSQNALALANSEYSWQGLVDKYTKFMKDING